jgi:hypothetical protein
MGEIFEVNEEFMKLAPKIMFILQYGDHDTYMSLWHKIEELCILTHEDRPGIREELSDKLGGIIPIKISSSDAQPGIGTKANSPLKMKIESPGVAAILEEMCIEMEPVKKASSL